MKGDGQDPWIIPKDAFGAVAVVGIDVNVGHLGHTRGQQLRDGQSGVVIDAESAGLAGKRVVHAAAKVHCAQHVPAQ